MAESYLAGRQKSGKMDTLSMLDSPSIALHFNMSHKNKTSSFQDPTNENNGKWG